MLAEVEDEQVDTDRHYRIIGRRFICDGHIDGNEDGKRNRDVTDANTQIAGLQTQVSTVQGQVSGLQSNVSSLQTQLKQAQDQATSLQSDLSKANSQISSLTSTNSNQAAQIKTMSYPRDFATIDDLTRWLQQNNPTTVDPNSLTSLQKAEMAFATRDQSLARRLLAPG